MDSTILKSLNVNGRLLDLSTPQVMGILNVTPDSFYAGMYFFLNIFFADILADIFAGDDKHQTKCNK